MKKLLKISIISIIIMQITTLTVFAYEKVQKLSDAENSIYKHFENRDKSFTFLYTGERKEFEDNIRDCIIDARSRDDYLERSWVEIKPTARVTEDGIETTINATYLTTKEQEKYVDIELEKVTKNLIKKEMTEFEKVQAINDYIITRYEYDYTQKSASAYSGLTTSVVNCQGYAMTAYKMFEYAGIENRIVVGKIGEDGHSWNCVKIEGIWYQLDTTNNDDLVEKNKYFLVGDDTLISHGYVWDRSKYPKALKGYFN
jgi:hypothetical protein